MSSQGESGAGQIVIAEDKVPLVQKYLPMSWRPPGMDVSVVTTVADLQSEVVRRGTDLDAIVCDGTLEEHHDGVRALEAMETKVPRYLWTGDTFLSRIRSRMLKTGVGWLDKLELPTVIALPFGARLSTAREVLLISPGGSWDEYCDLLQGAADEVTMLGPCSYEAAQQEIVETDRFGLVIDFSTIGRGPEYVPPSVDALQAIAASDDADKTAPRVVALRDPYQAYPSSAARIGLFRVQQLSS